MGCPVTSYTLYNIAIYTKIFVRFAPIFSQMIHVISYSYCKNPKYNIISISKKLTRTHFDVTSFSWHRISGHTCQGILNYYVHVYIPVFFSKTTGPMHNKSRRFPYIVCTNVSRKRPLLLCHGPGKTYLILK